MSEDLLPEKEITFVAKVRYKKKIPWCVIPYDVIRDLDLMKEDYLLLSVKRAKWYDFLDWSQMKNTEPPQAIKDRMKK